METVFQHQDYRQYLRNRLGGGKARTGEKKRASEALGVHTTLISQVLGEQCGLSLEQADRMNDFLGHSDDEAEYFLNLVQKDRAGTVSLRSRYEKHLKILRERNLQVHARVENDGKISEQHQRMFYSSYLYSAIHVLVSIARYNSVEKLASGLGLPRARVGEAVSFLNSIGVVLNENGILSPGKAHIHLSPESEYLSKHHLNWRLQMIERLGQPASQDLHYSAVVSLSQSDVEKIKESLLNNLKENSKTIMKSPEETAYVYCFDFFKLPLD
jgi:uncharacterized protein (TIGR02147 family)